jgi:hypothetical protein
MFELTAFHFFEQPFFYLDIVDLQYSKPPETDVSASLKSELKEQNSGCKQSKCPTYTSTMRRSLELSSSTKP